MGTTFYVGFGIALVLQQELSHKDILNCKSEEFIVQSSFLALILIVFYFYAVKVTREINKLVSASQRPSQDNDRDDQSLSIDEYSAYNINLSRKAAMRNIWVQLIWISLVTLEALLYSVSRYYWTGDNCMPIHVSGPVNDVIEYFDRFCEYQSWFIPLIWIYWPTKTNKQKNRRQVRAVKQLSVLGTPKALRRN